MSCGKPHETPCDEVIEQVWLYLDGELPAPDVGTIRSHLDECAPCLRKYGLEEVVKQLVARCGGGDVAPERLRAKVVASLHTITVEDGVVEQTHTRVEYRSE